MLEIGCISLTDQLKYSWTSLSDIGSNNDTNFKKMSLNFSNKIVFLKECAYSYYMKKGFPMHFYH